MIKVGSDFSGVGAFCYALKRIFKEEEIENVFACDMDKFARIGYIANHKEPKYFPENVYNRQIPPDSLDIYMTSPPCQPFSLVGKRKGKDDKRGVLFFNSHEFIKENKPRYFIFENVKGLLSDNSGKTFSEWEGMLGGKSINGNMIMFPHPEAVPYHIYWKVLNSKKHGVPQNRERVFIVGIRDDQDNEFSFPKEEHLTRKLKDILEDEVDEKYFLSNEAVKKLDVYEKRNKEKGNGFGAKFHDGDDVMSALKLGGGGCDDLVKIKSATKNICDQHGVFDGFRIRRLTPLERFRLQDFPDSHVQNSIEAGVSNSQLYRQAGNSITVRVLELIIRKLKLIIRKPSIL
jgi:DNA (cytosine-5)-methyltransferase 1